MPVRVRKESAVNVLLTSIYGGLVHASGVNRSGGGRMAIWGGVLCIARRIQGSASLFIAGLLVVGVVYPAVWSRSPNRRKEARRLISILAAAQSS